MWFIKIIFALFVSWSFRAQTRKKRESYKRLKLGSQWNKSSTTPTTCPTKTRPHTVYKQRVRLGLHAKLALTRMNSGCVVMCSWHIPAFLTLHWNFSFFSHYYSNICVFTRLFFDVHFSRTLFICFLALSRLDMADWKSHLTYNHPPAYHAYAYGILYANGFDQNLDGDVGVTNARSNRARPTAVYQTGDVVKALEESPPDSPEEHTGPGPFHYQGSEFNYAEQAIFNKQRLPSLDQRPHEARQTGSDTASDCETYISPGIETVIFFF